MNDEVATPGLLKKGNKYLFQARIPKAYLPHFPEVSKGILRINLQTSDRKKAIALVHKQWAQLHEEYERIDATGTRAKTTIPPEEAQRLILDDISSRLKFDDEIRDIGLLDGIFEAFEDKYTQANKTYKRIVASGVLDSTLTKSASEILSGSGYEVAEDSPEFVKFARDLAKARQRLFEICLKRHEGQTVETEEALSEFQQNQPQAPRSSKAPLLSKVVEYFLENYDSSKPMFRKHLTALPLFLECVGDKPVDQIKQIDIEDFSKLICLLPPRWYEITRKKGIKASQVAEMEHEETLSPTTFGNNYIGSLRPFLADAKRIFGDVGFPLNLTTEGVKYRGDRKEGEKKQRALTPKELKRLFEGREMRAFAKTPKDHSKYWLPMIGLYTGARVNEICQLNPQVDIREEEGIWIFEFTEESDTDERVRRSLKNTGSTRKTPIHPKLIELGLLSYVDSVKSKGSKLLFPDWPPSKGKASAAAEKWFRGLLRDIGLRDETLFKMVLGTHVFRHTLLNRALNLGIRDAEVITGHASGKSAVVRGYEGTMSLERKLKILEKITFDVNPKIL